MAELTIKVDGTIQEKHEKLSQAVQEGYKLQGISNLKMREAVSDLEKIKKIIDKGIVDQQDIAAIDTAFKKVSKIVDDAARKITTLTEAAQIKLKRATDLQEAKAEAEKRSRANADKTTNAEVRFRELAYEKRAKGITIGDKRGYVNLGTLNKYDPKTVPIYKDGELINEKSQTAKSLRAEMESLVETYRTSIRDQKELDTEVRKYANLLDKAEEEFKAQNAADIANGKTLNAEFLQQARDATGGFHNSMVSMKDAMAEEKRKQTLLDADLNYSGLTENTTKTTSSLGKVAKQLSIWTIGLRLARSAMNEVKRTIVDLDKSLTEQAMVTGKTRKEVYNLLGSYQELAIELGSTTKEVAAAVTEFIRQGKSTEDAKTLAKAAISAAKVAAINTSDSINYLTTALNGFQLSTKQAMNVSDKFAAISANAATSYEEIAIALSKVASQANLAGMSIDYTTALLAKGLETTREAPETIGTALKTVIARMREITDYGETLEDGVDLNNVESQLAYVGIQLRTTNGDLRSTESVLDDLGKKWDTLNSNQQAAIAKALAGTRQQSRLIAMMSDYERVIELQEISARSAGATMAQMGVYTQGLEASLNRLSTSWEEIVSTISNSDVIVNFVDMATNILDTLNEALKNTWGVIAAFIILGSIAASILATKIQEHRVQKLLISAQLEQRKTELQNLANKKAEQAVNKLLIAQEKKQSILAAIKRNEHERDLASQRGDYNEVTRLEAERLDLEKDLAEATNEEKAATIEYKNTHKELNVMAGELAEVTAQQQINSSLGLSTLAKFVPILSTILTFYHAITFAKNLNIKLTRKQRAEDAKNNAQEAGAAPTKIMSGMTSSAGWVGAIAGLAILTALGLGLAVALGAFNNSAEKKESEHIKELSNTIYTLTKRSEAIQTVTNKVADLDKNLIKTKEDTEALAEALDQVKDKLSGDKDDNIMNVGDVSEQEFYAQLGEKERIEFLEAYNKKINQQLLEADREMNQILRKADLNKVENRLQARSLAKRTAYRALDTLDLNSTETVARRTMLETIIDSSSNSKLKSMMFDLSAMTDILEQLGSIKIKNGSVASDVLQDSDASIKERTEAFKALRKELSSMPEVWEAIKDAYSEFSVFSEWNQAVLELVDNLKITNEELNTLYKSYNSISKSLKEDGMDGFENIMSEEKYQDILINRFLPMFAQTNMDVAWAMQESFGAYLKDLSAEDYESVYSSILNQIAKAVQVGVQNIGQNVDKLKSSITSIYDAAQKWDSMSGTEQSTFLNEHQDMFSGQSGAILLRAFQSKDYDQIRKALASNETLTQNRQNEIREIAAELAFEEAKIGAARNEALIKYLNDRLKQLQSDDFLSIDLETLVEQENKRIEAYKELLQKEQDALQKSLEERKDAYQKYFEAVNQSAEDEDYEEKAQLFVANLTKLAGSTNATAKAQTEELQNSLAELEKERLQTLRERAQEAVIQNIDDSIDEISEKFDELLANNREILNMLKGTSGNELVADLLSQESFAGKTANEAQLYLNEIQSTFGSQVSNIDWSNMSVTDNGGNLTLNIGDQVIQLTGQEGQGRSIKEAILAALIQNGINASM